LPGARAQYGPDRVVRVEHIDLWLRPDFATKTVHGRVTTHVRAIEDGVASLRLDAVDLEIERVTDAAGAELAFEATTFDLTIRLATPLAEGEPFAFVVTYRAVEPRRGVYFIDRPRQVWTQSQDVDARAWLPCFDHPAEKQTTSTTIVVEPGQFALGNGALVAREETPTGTVFRYEERVPHATYLLTMVVGAFSEIEQSHDRLPIFYYVEPGREAEGQRSFANTPRMIDVFESTIGVAYPYERYSQIAVADFIFGGMENTSATTQTDRTLHDERAHLDFSSDPLVSHELAHQWFGDLVTCRDWSQAWLNEGFATYFEAVWTEADLGWDEYQRTIYEIVQTYLEEDGDRYRRPIVCNLYRDPIELFDRHLYEKGGAVLHMLRGELGWDRMKRALRTYVHDNATRSVETIDLVRAIEGATGRNLRGFFDQWIERGGHPELEVRAEWHTDERRLSIEVEQKQTIDAEHPAYVFDLEIGVAATAPESIARDAGDGPVGSEHRVRLHVERAVDSFSVRCEEKPALLRVDPGAYVLCELKLAFEVDDLRAILSRDPAPVARIRAAKALGKSPASAARTALARALAHEPFWGVAVELAKVLGDARAPYARAALLAARTHAHPKIRAAVAAALGRYRDAEVADALRALCEDASYKVCAAAAEALGATRDPGAFARLVDLIATPSWRETIASGAARGLAALADERALAPLLAAADASRPEPLRRAALGALAVHATSIEAARPAVRDAIERALDDPLYPVRVSAYAAAETLGDAQLLPALERHATSEIDGRLRREAVEAAQRIRAAAKTPPELTRLREDIETLRAEVNRLRALVEADASA
jgi:aminopeptidase N